ncbi:tRNA-U20-dihydrouridine synthase [Geothermobacter ehrlichii]|uniref:tRNA-dihydrouridine synthase n=1 Tax=Geothermobacter ehrlichii TaxID=213224 RepID=A0A5D3WJY6_9BACT|nr:tRNA dihydrouridine synthase DusB [Geothermobacter ehrlichii]TYO98658.1 tRNA-U20-dihydrouridine synthase [Geothermobacter ehrlichii]
MQNTHPVRIAGLELECPVFLAPMAGITSLPYRLVMKEHGAALVFTEMVSCNGLVRDGRKTLELVRSCPAERPLGIQVFGGDPEIVAEGVRRLGDAGDLIDLNLGCPVSKVVRGEAGSALLRHPRRIATIVRAMRRATDKPLTVKIRSGWDSSNLNFVEIGRIAESEGADAVTLHPRTRAQGFGGRADWSQIGELKSRLRIPVIGSGDIVTAEDGVRMLRETGCDAIMIGRGSHGNPWLISNIRRRLCGLPERQPTAGERLDVVLRHLARHRECFGDRKTLFEMRKHLCWYSRGMADAATFRSRVNRTGSLDELEQLVRDFFAGRPQPGTANGS